jgi:hypothetical protein
LRVLFLVSVILESATGAGPQTVPREIKQVRQFPRRPCRVTRIRQAGTRIPQLVEEGLNHGINGRKSLCRRVLEKGRNEVNGVVRRFAKHLDPVSL